MPNPDCPYCASTAGYYTQTDVTPHRVRCYGCYQDRPDPPAAPPAKPSPVSPPAEPAPRRGPRFARH